MQVLAQIDDVVAANASLEAEVSMLFDRANIKRTPGGRRIPGGSSVSSRSTATSSRSRVGRGPSASRVPKTAAEAAAQFQEQRGTSVTKTTLQFGGLETPSPRSVGARPGSTSSVRSSKSTTANRLG